MNIAPMADHYRTTVEHLSEVEQLREALLHEYEGMARPATISQLHQDIGRTLKVAHVTSNLAIVQALHDQGLAR